MIRPQRQEGSVITVGIRREDKSKWERRAPLAPEHVKELVDQGLEIVIQPSKIRVFTDDEYREVGATVDEDLSRCGLVLAVKEVPVALLEKGKAYMYFSHTIKAQPYNMKMLGLLLDLGATLMDHEKVTDESGKRLVLFGYHAGLAGMIDSLWSLGKRYASQGIATPFDEVKQAYQYSSLTDAEEHLQQIGEKLRTVRETMASLGPIVVGLAGYGNVSRGAQHIMNQLGPETITPEALTTADLTPGGLYMVVFKEEHMATRTDGSPFELQTYFDKLELFKPIFRPYLDQVTALVNCIYWEDRYPRLVTRDDLKELYAEGPAPRLQVLGDISCDIDGSIEATVKATQPDEPCFVYDPFTGETVDGVEGRGPVVMSVDNLPCELPREATETFGTALTQFVKGMASADYSTDFTSLELPAPIKRAVITHKGELTPDFGYLEEHAIREAAK